MRDGEQGDPVWHPLQHFFGLTTFGANVFVAVRGTETLVEEHDELASNQQELYLVLDGERMLATRGTVVAIADPSVRRRAVARIPGTAILAVGAADGAFASTWHASHFADVPRSDR